MRQLLMQESKTVTSRLQAKTLTCAVHALTQETHTRCVFDRLPVVSWRRVKYKQMYGLKSTLTVSR